MDFPAHVPAAVRAHITTWIEGDSREPGWAASLENADETLARIDRAIETYRRRGEDDYLPSLRIQKAAALAHRDRLAREVGCLRRLGLDERMREAFALLTREFSDDKQWRNFIHAAWVGQVDFSKYRDRVKDAQEIKSKIADTADDLVKLIGDFSHLGYDNGPGEFYSIPALLGKTDNHRENGRNLHMWQSMRRHVLGDRPNRSDPESSSVGESIELMPSVKIVILPMSEKAEIDREEEVRNVLRYAWGTAPDFSALLGTVAKAARAFKPSESDMIRAAIASRQRSPKTQYLRAFGHMLTDGHGFTLTTPIMKAMAVVANVVINLPDVDVTHDDVRKALAKLVGEPLENSGEE